MGEALVGCESDQLGIYRDTRIPRSRIGFAVDFSQILAPSIINCLVSAAITFSCYLVLCGRPPRALCLGALTVIWNLAVGMGVAKPGNPGKTL